MLRTSTAALGLAAAALSPSYAVVGNDNYTPADLVDTVNVTGIGQMVVDQLNGYIGTCTATLINPRTVIFAAHCVNEGDTDFRDASSYGSLNGGYPIGFFFNANNNAKGNSAIGHWLNDYQTRTDEYAYNSNYVIYNTKSTELGFGNNFLQADIAMAALDTPASDIPTWTLLFSPITEQTHATIAGYGRTGQGTTGVTGSDYRRRVAENTISFLGSLDDMDTFLFGGPEGLPQNLYILDFNDPKFGTDEANRYDFNIFHNAALAKEAITAPGDSGGPLIIDQMFSQQVVAAVLSGGSRFFSGQPSASYGTTSFYQPLYLFWDWIVSNNPYKYVSAKAGDGSWTDPNHWVMDLDPNYVTIGEDGNLVNALPTTPAQGVPDVDQVNSPKFGQVCYFNDCYDIGTNQPVHYSNATSSQISSSPDIIKFDQDASDKAADPAMSLVQRWLESQATLAPTAILSGAPVEGAPGSSNFVPRNNSGDATHAPRYYDVTLSANGTTTLAGAQVIIDRLTVNGAKTALNITPTGGLGVFIDVTMYAGNLNVDGVLITNGDLALMGGVLSGSGIVSAPYTTAVLGAIAPGQIGTAGTLMMYGNVILSSRAGLLTDVGATVSDRLDVNGTLSLGGTLVVSAINGYTPKWRESKVIATADVITGKFDYIRDNIPGVLYPTVATVTNNGYDSEVVTFQAASFQSVLTDANPDQVAVGGVLDANRTSSYTAMQTLYDSIDTLSGSSLSDALTALVPNAARSVPQTAQLLTSAHTGFLWQYMGSTDPSSEPKLAVQTGSLKLAANSQTGSFEMRNMLASLGSNGDCTTGRIVCATDASSGGSDSSSGGMVLPKGVGAFLSGQKIDGNLKLGGNSGKADVDGYMIALGADLPVYEGTRVGLSFGFGEADTTLRDQPARTKTTSREVIAYGMYMTEGGYFANGLVGIGWQSFHSVRQATVGGTTFVLDGRSSAYSPLLGFQVGKAVPDVIGGTFKPAIGLQYGHINMDGYTETGGVAALSVRSYSRPSVDARVGFDSDWSVDLSGIVLKPQVHAFLVSRLSERGGQMTAGFAVAPDTVASYDVAGDSKVWADLGLKLDAEVYDNTAVGFTFNANPGNGGGTYTAFGGSLRVKF
jgi:V8-like Glu-specific endopeptidase/uncharacterized protein with beta-barrel porin domain